MFFHSVWARDFRTGDLIISLLASAQVLPSSHTRAIIRVKMFLIITQFKIARIQCLPHRDLMELVMGNYWWRLFYWLNFITDRNSQTFRGTHLHSVLLDQLEMTVSKVTTTQSFHNLKKRHKHHFSTSWMCVYSDLFLEKAHFYSQNVILRM